MKKIYFFTLLMTAIVFTGCAQTPEKDINAIIAPRMDIDQIYVRHSAFASTTSEYKIDLKNKTFWLYYGPLGDRKGRDGSLKNEGFTFEKNLEDEKIQTFLRTADESGMTLWDERYDNRRLMDGHQWSITIIFSDSTQKSIHGSNSYPKTWRKMCEAFYELTGKTVLYFGVIGPGIFP